MVNNKKLSQTASARSMASSHATSRGGSPDQKRLDEFSSSYGSGSGSDNEIETNLNLGSNL